MTESLPNCAPVKASLSPREFRQNARRDCARHGGHLQIARRANLPQRPPLRFLQIGNILPFVLFRQEGRIAIVTTREAGCGGREGAD
jgi:hypothetical protein